MNPVVVAGASNQVAAYLIPQLLAQGRTITAIARCERPAWLVRHPKLLWLSANLDSLGGLPAGSAELVYMAPAAHLVRTLNQMVPARVVLLTSTSVEVKKDSHDPAEQGVAATLQRAELDLANWARATLKPCTILRPTMIYGAGLDRNLTRMARLIERFGYALIAGGGTGRRQPVHAADVADAISKVLLSEAAVGQRYDLSGASTMTYREMVESVFASLDKPAKIVNLPLAAAKPVASVLGKLPLLRGISSTVLTRMSQDLIFDHSKASHDFGFSPRAFRPKRSTWLSLAERGAQLLLD